MNPETLLLNTIVVYASESIRQDQVIFFFFLAWQMAAISEGYEVFVVYYYASHLLAYDFCWNICLY